MFKTIIKFIECLPGSLYHTFIYAMHTPFYKWF